MLRGKLSTSACPHSLLFAQMRAIDLQLSTRGGPRTRNGLGVLRPLAPVRSGAVVVGCCRDRAEQERDGEEADDAACGAGAAWRRCGEEDDGGGGKGERDR